MSEDKSLLIGLPLSCDELRETGLITDSVVCCRSCHYDDNTGYISLIELYDGREESNYKVWARICCTVAKALKEIVVG